GIDFDVLLKPDLKDHVISPLVPDAFKGDDYEVLCAVPEAQLSAFLDRCAEAGVPAAAIGHVASGEGLPLFDDGAEQKRYERGSFSHF
ncbi:MAG: hypothetical protein AVDCRST_MAG90-1129, partial [uncultured Microvirga sp.]